MRPRRISGTSRGHQLADVHGAAIANDRPRADHGSALVIAVMALLVAGAAAASLAELGRLAVLRAAAARDATRAWYLAETALADVVSTVEPGTTFTGLLTQPPAPAHAPAGWSYAVTVDDDVDETPNDPATDQNGRVRLRISALGPSPTRRRLEAVLARTAPFWPAAVVLGGGVRDLTPDFVMDGRNYRMSGDCETVEGAAEDRLGLTLPVGSALPSTRDGQIIGTMPFPSVLRAEPPDLTGLATASGATHRPGGVIAGVLGTVDAPHFTVIDGDAVIDATVSGAGALFVAGRLRVAGRLDFVGVVAAAGGAVVDASGTVAVCGGLWAQGDPALVVDGLGRVRASSDAMTLAAGVAPLPARARVAAVRELFQ
jgi:hypothetical protein